MAERGGVPLLPCYLFTSRHPGPAALVVLLFVEKQAAAALHRRQQQDAMQGDAAAMVPFEPELLEVLTRDLFVHFGLFEFRPHQEQIVRALLERKRTP